MGETLYRKRQLRRVDAKANLLPLGSEVTTDLCKDSDVLDLSWWKDSVREEDATSMPFESLKTRSLYAPRRASIFTGHAMNLMEVRPIKTKPVVTAELSSSVIQIR